MNGQYYFGDLTSEEVRAAIEEAYTLVLPVGAIEQHGPHLPIDTDDYLANRGAREAVVEARDTYQSKVLYLPGVHYGNSFAHMAFPGRISLRFETFIALLQDILDELIRAGFRRFVLLNGNGGNEAGLTIAIRKVTESWRRQGVRVFIYIFGVGNIRGAQMPADFAEKVEAMISGNEGEIHAGARETSWNMADPRGRVRMDRLVKPVMCKVRWSNITLDDISSTGATGDPTQASAELGELFWEAHRKGLAKLLAEVSEGQIDPPE